jgi:hypothetical protein
MIAAGSRGNPVCAPQEVGNMQDNKIKARIVTRLYREDAYAPNQMISIQGAASMSVPSSDEGRAKQLLTDEMVDDDACPVVAMIAGQSVAVEPDDGKIAAYIQRNGGDVPWDLQDEL